MQVRTRILAAVGLCAALSVSGCDRFNNSVGNDAPPQNPNTPWPVNPQTPGSLPGTGQPGAAPASFEALEAWERQDMGVTPVDQLHSGQMHAPTPNQIPGGQVISTRGLIPLLQGAAGVPPIVLHVNQAPQSLPSAIPAAWAAAPGDFNDATQAQLGQMLMQFSQGNRQRPIVTYCGGPQCWMSYNAALRAIRLGFTNVLWYRGGLEAWGQAQAMLTGINVPSPNADFNSTGQIGEMDQLGENDE
jgi:PQQ-dependent catabolism-associated CXXCW motif protein